MCRGVSYRRSRTSHKDQTPQIRRTLITEGTGCINQRTHTIRLDRGSNEGSAPCSGSRSRFLGLHEFFFGVRGLGPVVGVSEDRAEDCQGGGVVEDCAKGDGGGFYRWEVCGGC